MLDTVPVAALTHGHAPTTHARLLAFVAEIAARTTPDRVRWCDGSDAEWEELTGEGVARGTLVRLDPARRPNSFYTRSDPLDVARVESRTFICADHPDEAGPTNNWLAPDAARATLDGLFAGAMRGRTMYVVPFLMGPPGAPGSIVGVELTDSPYVVLSTRIMARMGAPALAALGEDGFFVPCVHSVGAPLAPGQADVAWPCNAEKWIVHFPATREIWSFGSGYGGNALLGKKCLGLRIAAAIARDEGWLAEHMLLLKLTTPAGAVHYVAAAFPSACGKTNMAMLEPTLPGWRAETIGDDIAWIRVGADNRLWAVNPEAGFFGVAPGTGPRTNRHAVDTLARDTIFTNTALTADGADVWWEGLSDTPPAGLLDWHGHPWDPQAGPASHPNARFTAPAAGCPSIAPEWDRPEGVPLSAILFGGRRASAVPLVTEARSWAEGVYHASNIASEGTAAAENAVGELRRDPFAMLPFCPYHIADYVRHWLDLAARDGVRLPGLFTVNWFRKDANGRFVWPGFGENIRALAWIIGRIENTAAAVDTPIGRVPAPGALDTGGLDLAPGALELLLGVDRAEWTREAAGNRAYLASLGERVPAPLLAEQAALEARLAA